VIWSYYDDALETVMFRYVMPCGLVEIYQSVAKKNCCFRLQISKTNVPLNMKKGNFSDTSLSFYQATLLHFEIQHLIENYTQYTYHMTLSETTYRNVSSHTLVSPCIWTDTNILHYIHLF
jgi:hypothetical protein